MFALIGKATVLILGLKVIHYFWTLIRLYLLPKFGMKVNLRKYGEWAVVTGSTDGIGKEYARQLAHQGFKLALISRSKEKLDAVAEEIKKECDTEIKNIVFDFSNLDGYEKIAEEISSLEIGVLVNNVGVSYEFPDFFCDIDIKTFENMLKINCVSVLKMIHMVLPAMRDRKKGVIINISSAAALRPMPLLSVYSASKAFVDYLSRAIQIEYKKYGIICQATLPYFVTTKLSGIKRTSALTPSAKDYVASQLGTVGKSSRVSGFLSHAFNAARMTLPPGSFIDGQVFDALSFVRIKALRKRKIL